MTSRAIVISKGLHPPFNIYISKQGYVNYVDFTTGLEKAVKRLSSEKAVKIYLKNLSEAEKWSVIRENHVLLFPSLTNAAIDPPLVVLEGMFMGRCIIAALVQTVNEDGIYKVIRELQDDPEPLKT